METINHEYYVSPEVANLLEKARFDWKQYSFYNSKGVLINGTFAANWNDKIWDIDGSKVSAPTLEVVQRWLREVKKFEIIIERNFKRYQCRIEGYYKEDDTLRYQKWVTNNSELFNTYEEAQEAGIKKALEIILEKGE